MRGDLDANRVYAPHRIPERFRAVHQLYLETYAQRISDVYACEVPKLVSCLQIADFSVRAPNFGTPQAVVTVDHRQARAHITRSLAPGGGSRAQGTVALRPNRRTHALPRRRDAEAAGRGALAHALDLRDVDFLAVVATGADDESFEEAAEASS
jgi:hypothetical protein